jgi:hypothetical protein
MSQQTAESRKRERSIRSFVSGLRLLSHIHIQLLGKLIPRRLNGRNRRLRCD